MAYPISSDVSRRSFLGAAGAVAAGLAMRPTLSRGQVVGGTRRPNILYIFTDQQFADAMSCAGCPYVKTPAMDELAARGVRFTQAYPGQPICTPARACMWTGLMPHEIPVMTNSIPIPERWRPHELGIVMANAGYDCGYAGKWHLPVYRLDDGHGFERLSRFYDAEVTVGCVNYLKRKHDRPFFLVASYLNPHDICGYPGRGLNRLENGSYPDAPPEQWPPIASNFAIPLREPGLIRQIQSTAREHPTWGWDEAKWRHYRYAYYRMVERVDAEIGRVLATLREQGLEENTVIIFSSDHGDGLGAHGWNQKSLLYEETARVPFIISYPGRIAPGGVDRDHPVSVGPDLFATICDYANVRPPEHVRGHSVRRLVEHNQSDDWPDQIVVQTTLYQMRYQGRMLRTRRYKYSVYSEGHNREMLVDLEKDPGEMLNLAGYRPYDAILNEHRNRLATWCRARNDTFPYVEPGTPVGPPRPATAPATQPATGA